VEPGHYVVTVLGRDRPGLIRDILGPVARGLYNIVDVEQSVLQGLFVMFMLIEPQPGHLPPEQLAEELKARGKQYGATIRMVPASEYRERRPTSGRKLYVATVMARDRVGLMLDAAGAIAGIPANIEHSVLVARGDFITIQFLVDVGEVAPQSASERLKAWARGAGADLAFQRQDIHQREKRLVVFDMDSTIVDGEIIDMLARAAGVEREVAGITRQAMEGAMEFEEALRRRVRLLRGLPASVLDGIAANLRLTPGSEELLMRLKSMGYKTALISGGFTFFTDVLKRELHFDYAFGNELEIEGGILTGNVKGRIIDARAKGEIIFELARNENISPENVVAVGDGANDRLMLANAGLGVAFDAKELLRRVSDGTLSRENIKGLLNILGHTEPGI